MSFKSEQYIFDPFKNTTELTKTEKTKSNYIKRALLLSKRVGEIYNNFDYADPRQIAAWLKQNRFEFSRNTFRQYKSSLIYYFVSVLKTPEAYEAAEFLLPLTSELSIKKSTKTSAKKSKHISQTNFDKLISYLLSTKHKYAMIVIYWLQAGLLCGLRPSEWNNTELVDYNGLPSLEVANGKNTNGRANGKKRILILSKLTNEELEIIKQHLYNIKSQNLSNEEFDGFVNRCGSFLSVANKTVFGDKRKHITLYSSRHQFSANAKASNLSKSEVAALMGHAVDNTAILHYGKKKFGKKSAIRVEPTLEQVQQVRKIENTFFDDKLNYLASKQYLDYNTQINDKDVENALSHTNQTGTNGNTIK